MPNSSFEIIYNRTLRFLSFRPRSEKEVIDYLLKKETEKEYVNKILNKLKEYKFVDDLGFAKWWIENKKKGQRLLTFELKQKGIAKEIIEEAVSSLDIAKKEEVLINKLIEKKWRSAAKTPEKAYERLMRYLMGKGFDYDDAKKAVRSKIKLEDLVDD